MSDEIKYPQGFGLKDVVAWGTTGLVVVDEPSQTVIKTPLCEDFSELILREQEVYERFTQCGGHPGVLRYYGTFESGIRLEYAPNGDLRSFNNRYNVDIDIAKRLRWATQIAEALDFAHRSGVIHGDLTCHNIFLDRNLNVKLADFAGSSVDGSPLLVAVTASHEHPESILSPIGDLFAFGSVLYEIMTGNTPYAALSEDEICTRYSKGEFPDTTFLKDVGGIIRNCWQSKYGGAGTAIKDLKRGTFTCFQSSSKITDVK